MLNEDIIVPEYWLAVLNYLTVLDLMNGLKTIRQILKKKIGWLRSKRTTFVRIKGIKRYKDQTGKWYCYHRKSSTRIKSDYGSPEFFTELAAIEQQWKAENSTDPSEHTTLGSLGRLIMEYKQSSKYLQLAPRTQSDYLKVFDYLAPLKDMPLVKIYTPFLARLRDKTFKLKKRRFANYVVALMSVLMGFAKEYGYATTNPARGLSKIPRPKNMPSANRPWTLKERRIILEQAPWRLKVPIAIGMFTGLRVSDVLRLPKSSLKEGWIQHKTSKTGEVAQIPATQDLLDILHKAPQHDATTFCANSKGMSWTENSFKAAFYKFIKALEEDGVIGPNITFHGLRHSVATILKENGASYDDIAAWLTHQSITMARHYSKTATNKKRMEASMKKFDPLGSKKQKGVQNKSV